MVSVTGIICSVGSFVGRFAEGKILAEKATGVVEGIWEGNAKTAFDENYGEVNVDVAQVCSNYEEINQKLSALQSSIEAEESRRREERLQQRLQQQAQRRYGR